MGRALTAHAGKHATCDGKKQGAVYLSGELSCSPEWGPEWEKQEGRWETEGLGAGSGL